MPETLLHQMPKESETEHELLSYADFMWFCVECIEEVKKVITTDIKIEER